GSSRWNQPCMNVWPLEHFRQFLYYCRRAKLAAITTRNRQGARSMKYEDRTALVLGAGGGIGGELARQLRDRGWSVRAMGRSVAPGRREGIDWITGDALDRAAVAAAARGCAVIAHAVNPPGYRRWNEVVLPMLDNSLAAAGAEGATVLLPGTVYNYGPDVPVLAAEDAPQNPVGRKGAI